MDYPESKVYSDGSHYIAIPHTTRRKRQPTKEEITSQQDVKSVSSECASLAENPTPSGENADMGAEKPKETERKPKYTTRKDIFNVLYDDSRQMTKSDRRQYMRDNLLPFFEDEEGCEEFIKDNFARKNRNSVARRIRLNRKVTLQEWNYFCTFTYDSKKHTEQSFQKKLRMCLANLCVRKGWKYIGVWERSPEKHRLHFHGLFYIPADAMVGKLEEVEGYSFATKQRRIIMQNTWFAKRFGRNEFSDIGRREDLRYAIQYLVKYIEKTGERIVYSKGLPQYFISDIWQEDVLCRIGIEDRKLLLFDDFTCRTNGKRIGKVSRETIAKMPKSNT